MNDLLAQLQSHFGDAYAMERELGGGGMSRVVLARDTRLDRRVVIKILPPSVTAGISAERFEREIMLSAALQHPNIVPVLNAGKVDGLPYFLMPFIEGESLRARMMRGPLSARETVNILKDVTRALAFAHGRGIIHRDIKPDNVLITTGGAAVVTDFGVAKALSASVHSGEKSSGFRSMTGIGMSPGTPAYMAPEQAAADPLTDHRADLYALGIVGYEMLAGAPPFHGRSAQALLAAQMSEKPAPVSSRRYDIPKALADVIMQCLEKEPKKRPESAAWLLRVLEDPSVVSGVFAVPESSSAYAWRSTAIAVGILAVVAAFAFWRTSESADPSPTPATPPAAAAANRSLAVLPLAAVGNDTRTRDVAEGLTSEVLNAVAGVEGFRVPALAAARAASDSGTSLLALGRSLNVTPVVEGTVQRERDRLRVVLRMVRIANDSTVWAESFNGSTDSTLALQGTIARAVAAAASQRAR